MSYLIKHILDTYRTMWFDAKPLTLEEIDDRSAKQRYNDRALIELKRKMIYMLTEMKDPETLESPETRDLIRAEVQDFMVDVLGIASEACDLLYTDGYLECGKAFVRRAHEVADLSNEDVQQALRNIWVMNAFQVYFNQQVRLTDAMFGYSMLYPLTDNYLDDVTISKAEKKSFNKRFYTKIKYGEADTCNGDEALIFSMIDLIASQYSRESHAKVFESLLAILDGQNKSIDQQGLGSIYDKDLLSYTFYKGGSSVLADAYLVKGDLTEEEAIFAFGYGIILQIADDFQDIDEDLGNNHMTLPNTQSQHGRLDGFYLKYEGFTDVFFQQYFPSDTDERRALWQLLRISIGILIDEAVVNNKRYFSRRTYRRILSRRYFTPRAAKKYNGRILSLGNVVMKKR